MSSKRAPVDYTRQLGIFDPSKFPGLAVTVVGAGGIGGPTTLALAKLGIRTIKVYDFDRVDAHNQPNQIYGLKDLRDAKVNALRDIVKGLADVTIRPIGKRLTKDTQLQGIVIGAVDSMAARSEIWQAVLKAGKKVSLYLDGRLGEQVIRVLTVRPERPKDVQRYIRTIVPQHAVVPMRCTAAGIIDVSFSVAALITRSLRLALTNPKEIVFDLFYDHRNLSFLKA
jgi:molybdopterin/thiamine biosynthesis adenylyltransferase